MKHVCKTTAAIFLAIMMLLGSALAYNDPTLFKWQTSTGSQSSAKSPIFSEYANSTQNILRATIDGERITFYLAADGQQKPDGSVTAAYLAYYPNGAARCIFLIQLPKDIDSGTKVMESITDVYYFSYFDTLNDDLSWDTPAYQLLRGEINNADYHANYGSFSLVTGDCSGSHYSGTLDCTLTSFTYNGDYHYDGSDTIDIKDIEFDFTVDAVHPVFNELGISKEGKLTDGSNTSGSQQTDSQRCSYCYGLGRRECGVCGSFGQCGACDGFGHFTRFTSNGLDYEDCYACRGTGQCSNCGYSGFVTCIFCDGTGRAD